ncbi:MAG: AIR synthase family protein [Desulfurococcaceae archaeon TW002]
MKLRPESLKKYVLDKFKSNDSSVVLQADVGIDAAAVKTCDEFLVGVHPDPISGAVKYLGTLSIIIPANDVAMIGAYPKFFTSVILLPEGSSEDLVDMITNSMKKALDRYRASMIGGHTEFTDSVKRPITITTAFGILKSSNLVDIRNIKEGDLIIMSKYAGIEGTAVLSSDFRETLIAKGVSEKTLNVGEEMINLVSVVEEATLLSREGLVSGMHDPTEGGILGGLAEMAYASGKLIRVYADKILLHEVTIEITKALGLDPLRILSSGALLASVPKERVEEAVSLLKKSNIEVSVIGEVLPRKHEGPLLEVLKENSKEYVYDPYVEDEVMKLWSMK